MLDRKRSQDPTGILAPDSLKESSPTMSISIADMLLTAAIIALGAVGTYLMLPHRHGLTRPRTVHGAGLACAGLALLAFLTYWTPPADWLPTVFLYVFGIMAIVGALLTVTSRNPVHSALWFASVVLSTSGLFILADAPFLAAGTIIVYAGAIIVTFLFVIMLAQMEGKAVYDRAARAPGAATFTCYFLFWSLIVSLSTIRPTSVGDQTTEAGRSQAAQFVATERGRYEPERQFRRSQNILRARGETAGAVFAVLNRALTPTSQIMGATSQIEGPSGSDLQLIPSADDVNSIPSTGRDQIIGARVNQVLHFRILDEDGKMVVDTDETRLTNRTRPIDDLKKQLDPLWPPHELTEGEKSSVIVAVTSIVGYSRPDRAKPNVAGLGESLYTDHLVTVGLASALLFVALVGAVAITNPKRPGQGPDPAQVANVGTNRP